MSRESSGCLYESPKGSGRWHGKSTMALGRRSVRLPECRTLNDAKLASRPSFSRNGLSRHGLFRPEVPSGCVDAGVCRALITADQPLATPLTSLTPVRYENRLPPWASDETPK